MMQRVNLIIHILVICGIFHVFGWSEPIKKRNQVSETKDSMYATPAPIANDNNSIQYHLYTPENPKVVCYFEPEVSNNCSFNASYEMKILIHGYTVELLPGNLFEQMKDTLLEYNKYNVIIVNWTQYDGYPYTAAVTKAFIVGRNVGQMVNFLVSNRGMNHLDVHLIGHSLGAHISGVAGKQVSSLGRITGLDPAGQSFSKAVRYNRLTYDSADFVDVIHTSNYMTGEGFGLSDAIGSIDIYPNGGNKQPACKIGGTYSNTDGTVVPITSNVGLAACYHDIAVNYFINSIHICNYPCVECASYRQYAQGRCDFSTNSRDRMGLYSASIPGLPVESTFYLNTSASTPYC